MKKFAIVSRTLAVVAIWLTTLPLLGVLVSSDDWFWYHYIGTMPIDTYRFISATLGIGAFFGAIALTCGAVVATLYVLGAFRQNPKQKTAVDQV